MYQEFNRVPRTQYSFSGKFDILAICHLDIAIKNLLLDGQERVWILD
jgi:thiamine kinase-like enzyme